MTVADGSKKRKRKRSGKKRRIGKQVIPVGGRVTVAETTTMKLNIVANGKTVRSKKVATEHKEFEVLEVAGLNPSKARVTYTAKTEVETEGDKSKTEVSELQGKTFVLERKNGEVVVSWPDGRSVAGALRDLAKEDNKMFGNDIFLNAIPNRQLEPGSAVGRTRPTSLPRSRWRALSPTASP